MFRWLPVLFVVSLTPGLPTAIEAAEKFDLRDGDRVVFLGNTLIERAQKYGYIESVLTRRSPKLNIVFRNLGWSGDTVFAESRGIFDPPAKGYQRMIEHLKRLKPTVVVLGYGGNEAFAGAVRLPRFLAQFRRLLDDINVLGVREFVILSPTRLERLGPPLPDPAAQNKQRLVYRDALRDFAVEHNHAFVDLFAPWGQASESETADRMTYNGMHFTDSGYRRAADRIANSLGLASQTWQISIDASGEVKAVEGAIVKTVKASVAGVAFQVTDAVLPDPSGSETSSNAADRRLKIANLAEGVYTLKIDGKSIATATSREWSSGRAIQSGPDFDQSESLRQTIIKKNRLYFYRWRPQNVTYLFGFRKHEQGNNAKEVAEFDKLVAEEEAKIAKLRRPVSRKYEIARKAKAE